MCACVQLTLRPRWAPTAVRHNRADLSTVDTSRLVCEHDRPTHAHAHRVSSNATLPPTADMCHCKCNCKKDVQNTPQKR